MMAGLLLAGGTVVNPQLAFRADVRVRENRIVEIGEDLRPTQHEVVLDCSEQYLYPGLINAHDHLSFNLFPRLGEPPYPNSYEWGKQIRSRFKSVVDQIVRIPLRDRLYWGAWKNLFSGVTTVVHHDPYFPWFRMMYPVHVFKHYTMAHSLGFEKDIQQALARRRNSTPFMIHVAEGVDDCAAGEVGQLQKLGGLDSRTVAIHAVGIQDVDIQSLHDTQASVIWCPASNYFLFEKTAPVAALYGKVRVAIGTDSTITGSPTLFEEMRAAQKGTSFSPKELFGLVTDSPRRIFGLPNDSGVIVRGGRADLLVLRAAMASPYLTLLHAEPGDISLLLRQGKVLLHDRCFDKPLGHDTASSPRVTLNGKTKWIGSRVFPGRYRTSAAFLQHFGYLGAATS